MQTSKLSKLTLEYGVILALFPKAFEGKPSIKGIVENYRYSTDWAQGGPIIEREKLTIEPLFFMESGWRARHHNLKYDAHGEYVYGSDNMSDGPTPLIAALRCFVASKLGDDVEIPEELNHV